MSKFFSGMKNSIKQKVGGLISNVKQQIQPDTKKNKDTPNQHQQPPNQLSSQSSISPTSSVLSSTSTSSSFASQQPVTKKPFNIQLSEDDKDLYNLNPGEDDDDEEEEEGEDERDEQICTDSKPKQSNVIPTNLITPQIFTNTNSSTPIDNTEPLSSTRSNNSSIYIEQKDDSLSNKAKKEDPNTFCHRLRKKNTLYSLDEVQYYSVHKFKEKESFLSSFGFVDSKVIKKEYIAFFEEGYLYFSKNIIVPNKNLEIRKLGNKYSLKDITNIFFEKDRSFMSMHLEFYNNNNEFGYIQKDFYIHIDIVDKFIKDLQQRLKLLGIECSSNDDVNQEDDNQEGEQEEEPSNESSIKVEMPSEIQLMDR